MFLKLRSHDGRREVLVNPEFIASITDGEYPRDPAYVRLSDGTVHQVRERAYEIETMLREALEER